MGSEMCIRDRYYLPDLPFKIQKYLNKFANSSMDISDGLFSDIIKLMNDQKFGFIINLNKLPISANLKHYIKKKDHKFLKLISKGDDYQVLFTSSKKYRPYIKKLSKRINQKITLIGEINNRFKQYRIYNKGKILKPMNFGGYSHNF